MPYNKYLPVTKERYEILCDRFERFSKYVHDVDTKPVRVFDPLNEKQLKELAMIREVSKDLQRKRDEDVQKAAQQAAEAEKKAKEVAAQQTEVPAEATPVEA